MNKTAYRLFISVLVFSPLAFGAVETWSIAAMEFLAFIGLYFLYVGSSGRERVSWLHTPGLIPLGLFLFFVAFQVFPLPSALLRLISPSAHSAYGEIDPAGQGIWDSLSVGKKSTLMEFFRYASYAAVYIITAQMLREKEDIKKTLSVILLLTVAIAFFGTLQHLIPNRKIYWVRELTLGGTPFGPFVNRNHYAGFMGMLFPTAFSLFLYYRPVLRHEPLRQKIVNFFGHPMSNIHAFLGFASLVMATSIFLSLSRGGIASLSMAVILLGMLLNRSIRQSRIRFLFILSVVVILYAVGWFGWGPVFERFRSIRNIQGEIAELRLDLWKDSLMIIKDFPVFGSGFGSFLHIYPTYRTISSEGIADHAHNDYIELFTDGGIVGALVFFWFVGAVVLSTYRNFLMRKDPFAIHLYAGVLAGVFTLMVHSFTDFNLHIGSNALFFFFLLGLLVSSSRPRTEAEQDEVSKENHPTLMRMIGLASCCLAFVSLALNSGQMLSRFYAGEVRGANYMRFSPENLTFQIKNMKRAILLDPFEAEYPYMLAKLEFRRDREVALKYYWKAAELNPLKSEYLQSLGMALSEKGDGAGAERFLRLGVYRDKSNPAAYKRLAAWLKMHGRPEEGLSLYRQALLLEPQKTGEYVSFLGLMGYDSGEIRNILPEKASVYLIFAEFLEKTGREQEAAESFHKALDYAGRQSPAEPSPFFRASDFFMRKGLRQEAFLVMGKAVALLPDSAVVRLRYAELFDRSGFKERALAEYGEVLKLDPGNAAAKKRLAELR